LTSLEQSLKRLFSKLALDGDQIVIGKEIYLAWRILWFLRITQWRIMYV